MNRSSALRTVVLSCFVGACGNGERQVFDDAGSSGASESSGGSGTGASTSEGGQEAGESTDGSGTATTASSSEASSGDATADEGGGPRLDVGPDSTGGIEAGDESGEEGCEKVDFLFVIDNSGSMGNHQNALIASFPNFISLIQSTLEGQDYHVMVVDTDGQDICDQTCSGGANFCAIGGLDCGAVPPLAGCDVELGAGRTLDINKAPCPVDGTDRYLTQNESDLSGTFECIARVGAYGDGNEQPMGAMMQALSPTENVGGCNDGFLRDDAILVLTVLSDAPPQTADEQVAGVPMDWYDAVIAAKHGNSGAVSVVGLVSDGDVPGGLCDCGGSPSCPTGMDADWGSPKHREFVELFPYHVLGSTCEPDYSSFFTQAVQIIDQSCDGFIPPG